MPDPIEDQIEQINKKIDQLMKRFEIEQIPPPPMYRLGDAEFMFRVVQLVQSDLIKERFDLSDDEYDLLIKQKWFEQAEMMLKNTKKAKMKAQVAVPQQQRMFLPPGVEL